MVICLAVGPLRAHRTTVRRSVIRRIYKIRCSRLYFSARSGYKTSRIVATTAAAQLARQEGTELGLLELGVHSHAPVDQRRLELGDLRLSFRTSASEVILEQMAAPISFAEACFSLRTAARASWLWPRAEALSETAY